MELVRIRTLVDLVYEEGFRILATPLRRVAAGAVIKNPCAGRYVEDLSELFETGAELGKLLGEMAVAQLGVLEPVLQATVVALGDLAVEQQGEPFGVVELVGLGLAAHLVEGLGHAGEAEFAQLVACRVVEHLI